MLKKPSVLALALVFMAFAGSQGCSCGGPAQLVSGSEGGGGSAGGDAGSTCDVGGGSCGAAGGGEGGDGGAAGSSCEPACPPDFECLGGTCKAIPPACGPTSAEDQPGGFDSAEVRAIAASPAGAQNLLVGTRSGVYRSDDDGATWTFWGLPGLDVRVLRVTPSGTTLAGTHGAGVFRRSIDGDWESAWAGVARLLVTDIEIAPQDPETIYVTALLDEHYPEEDGALYRSHDGGDSWDLSFDYTVVCAKLGACSAHRAADVRGIEIDPLVPSTLWLGFRDSDGATQHGLWRSVDGGLSWDPATALDDAIGGPSWLLDLRFAPAPSFSLYVEHGGGSVLRGTADGSVWTPIASIEEPLLALEPAAPGSVHEMHAAHSEGLASIDDAGAWIEHSLGGPATAVLHRPGALDVGSNDGVARSDDEGASWVRRSHGLNGVTVRQLAVSAGTLFAATSAGLHRSADGAAWSRVAGGLPSHLDATAIAVDPFEPETLLLGVVARGPDDPHVYLSRDQGATWSPAAVGLPRTFHVVHIAVLRDGSERRFALLGNDAEATAAWYESADPEGPWLAPPAPFASVLSATATPVWPDRVWVGATSGEPGVFDVGTEGVSGPLSGGSIGAAPVWSLAVAPEPFALWAGVYDGAGAIYRRDAGGEWVSDGEGTPAVDYIPTALFAHRWSGVVFSGFAKARAAHTTAPIGLFQRDPGSGWSRRPLARGAEVVHVAADPWCRDRVFAAAIGGGLERVHFTGAAE